MIYCDGIKEEEKAYCGSDGLKTGKTQGLQKEVIAFIGLPDTVRIKLSGSEA